MEQNLANIGILKSKLSLMDSNASICDIFGKLKAMLEKDGKIIDDADLFVAACALDINATLVTNNEKHFKRIKGLKLAYSIEEGKKIVSILMVGKRENFYEILKRRLL